MNLVASLHKVQQQVVTRHFLDNRFSASAQKGRTALQPPPNQLATFTRSSRPSRLLANHARQTILNASVTLSFTKCKHVSECSLLFTYFTMDLSSDYNSSTSKHEEQASSNPCKRQRCPEKWLWYVNKCNCDRGEAYNSQATKKMVENTKVGSPCTCPEPMFC